MSAHVSDQQLPTTTTAAKYPIIRLYYIRSKFGRKGHEFDLFAYFGKWQP